MHRRRRLSSGAEIVSGGTRFRLYAPALREVAIVMIDSGRRIAMRRSQNGWFEATVSEAGASVRYCYEIAPGEQVPDPASRFQPEDVFGPSEVVDPLAYEWDDEAWLGRPWHEAVVYELHVGCFGEATGFDGVRRQLDHLERLGVTAVELMPVADFAGARNWGYDGVLPYAPDSAYGRPEDLKRLVDACHARGLMALLDVVYNHFGPSGNFLGRYAPQFFHPRIHTPWGAALAFDNPLLRNFFVENALYWLQEYHCDGLRLDAVHAIEAVPGGEDFLDELATRVRADLPGREVHLVLENDRNEAHWLPRNGARPRLYTAQWNDDFHHAAHTAATGETDGYYADYADAPVRHLARTLAEGFAYQGEISVFRDGRPRGERSVAVDPPAFVNFLQNHDQVGNRAFGERLNALVSERRLKALYTLLLLSPAVPLLFMGEEWASDTPFLYFCDFPGELGEAVRNGRRDEFRRFAAFRDPAARSRIPDPISADTFLKSCLDWEALGEPKHAQWLTFVRGLIACRRRELLPRLPVPASGEYRMAAPDAFTVEWRLADHARWRLEANLGETKVRLGEPAARLIHAQPATDGSELAPWSVRVVLDD